MKFNVDHHWLSGRTHINQGTPCQDYAVSQSDEAGAVAVISDGCSEGNRTELVANRTEAGAAIIALSTAHALTEVKVIGYSIDDAINQRLRDIIRIRYLLGLRNNDLLATSICASMSPEGGFVLVEGDGVLAFKKRDGGIGMEQYSWAANMPYYPIYWEDPEQFVQAHGGLNQKRLYITQHRKEYGKWEESTETVSVGDGIVGIRSMFTPNDLSKLEAIALFSDGITQIDGLDWRDAVEECLGFHSYTGLFVKRRFNAVVKRHIQLGHIPQDDLSLAVIHINDDAES